MTDNLVDPLSSLVEKKVVVVYTPRRQRNRFPENCVEVKENIAEAIDAANPAEHRYPAIVYGPSRSSEGLRLYYLVEWLEDR